MKKLHLLKTVLLLCALIVGSNSLWAQTTVSMTSFDAISGNVNGDDNVSYIAEKGTAGTAPGVYDNEIRVYQNGGTFTITANNGCKIQSVTLGSSMATTVKYSIDGGADSDNKSITAGGTTTVSGLNCSSLKFTCTGTSKSSRLYVNSLSVTYSGGSSVAKPTFSPEGGAVEKGTTVELTTSTDGATIYYTKGENPADPTSTSTPYTGAITINEATTIKAIAIKNAESSVVATAEYTIKKVEAPTFSIASGTAVIAGTTVELETETEGATIHYTTDNTVPTSESATYSSAITIDANMTIKAIAIKNNWDDSEVVSASYTVITPISGLAIDFEVANLTQYTDWEFTNAALGTNGDNQNISARTGTHYGTTGGKATASIQTKAKVAKPVNFTCYVSKQSNNTTSSTWYVQVSSDGSNWSNVETQSATSMSAGTWVEFTANLSSYSNVYVRLYYSGSTAIRNVDDIVLTEAIPATISAVGWATFSSDKALDFTDVEGLEAYMITGHDGVNIVKSQVTGTVPANTGLLLKGDADTYSIPVVASSSTDVTANKMVAGTGEAVSAESGKTKYVLSVNGSTGKAEFQKIVSTPATVSAGKAYLQFNEVINARALQFEDEGETTALNEVRSLNSEVRGEYFNLNGQRVAQPTKGLYIVNGKKVVIK